MDIKVTKTLVDKKISKYYFSLNHSYSNAPVVTGDITDIDEDTVMFDWFIRPDPSGDAVFNESWQSSLSGTNIIYAFKVTGNYSVWVKAVDGKGGTDVKKLLTGIIIEEHITPSSGPDGGLGGWLYVIISIIVLISIVVIAFILIVNRKGYVKENETGGIATGDERMGNRSQFGINQIEHPPAGMQKPLGISIDISPAITTFACDMCNGNIAIGDLMITCHCKKRYHPECIIRKGDCPICGVIYSHMNNEQGFSRTKGNNSVDIPMDDADSNVDNTANNAARTYRVYSSLTCQICFGHIKKGDRAHQCGCGKIFHPSCIARVGECPTCELVYSSDQFSSYGNDNEEKASGNDSNQVVFEDDDDDEYSPPKYTGDILTSEPQEKEIPNVITTTDVNTVQGSYHLYNMLLAKKGSEIRIGPVSSKSDIGKARKQIIMMYHPDKWQSDKDKATFFMQKVNVAWEVLSAIPR